MLLVRNIAFRDADFMLGVGCLYRLMTGVDPRDENEAHLRQETKSRYRAIWDQALRHGTTEALFNELSDSMAPVPSMLPMVVSSPSSQSSGMRNLSSVR